MKNREGYTDVTASSAIGRVDGEKKRLEKLTKELNAAFKRNGFTANSVSMEDSTSHNKYELKRQKRDNWR